MTAPDRRKGSSVHDGRLSRRRLVVLLAASAVAALAACGEPEKRKPGGYDFPGAEKDEKGRFKSSQTF